MQPAIFECLYCAQQFHTEDSSLEHAIPQFMGGAYAPSQFMLENACRDCNNKLGLFVDASYAKSWFVTNGMTVAAGKLYRGLGDSPLPLVCIGKTAISGLVVPPDHVAEHWIGPSGETIVWVRYEDERTFWYSGGNPTDRKRKPSAAYLFLTSQDSTRWQMGIASFLDAFKSKKIRKILGTPVAGLASNSAWPGFDVADAQEISSVAAIRAALAAGTLLAKIRFNGKFDQRFIAKMSLAVGYSLFGEPYLATEHAHEARKGCWPSANNQSKLRGAASLVHQADPRFSQLMGYPGGVALCVTWVRSGYVLNVTIDEKLPFTVELAPSSLTSAWVDREGGYVLLLFPQLRKALELTLPELIAHSTGVAQNMELDKLDAIRSQASSFMGQLGPVQ
ncbi:HNH endonuclease [Paraburkholderia sediminicola]|uniref:HNH endonuclease n=1 Tax=Paraburkholderia sediminicola TaxID=458836 RepID=UPI0038BD42EE